jgi:hypothetical protein
VSRSNPAKRKAPTYGRQVLASLLAAVLIVGITIFAVTAAIGPVPDARELRELQELQEERREDREGNSGG